MRTISSWKKLTFLGIIGLAAASVRADSPIQWQGSPGWESQGAYCRLYDAKSVVTLQGTVASVQDVAPLKGMGNGIHLILQTSTETIPVQLGPEWFVKKQSVQILAQDAVEVTGSRVPCDGKDVIMAAFVKKGDQVVRYRSIKGIPKWTGEKP